MAIGDFNAILISEEKMGGKLANRFLMKSFQSFMDLGSKEALYTWTNKQTRNHNVKERIDRAVIDTN